MASWFHRLMNPHCPHCVEERKEAYEREKELRAEHKHEIEDSSVCPSCETYKRQLEIANNQNEKLLERLLEKPAAPVEDKTPVQISKPKMIPWNVRRQMLEAEDRKRADLLRNAPTPQPAAEPVSTEDLEKEVLEVEQTREAQGNV